MHMHPAHAIARCAHTMEETLAPLKAQRSRSIFWMLFPSVMLPMFLAVADQTIVATALPVIAAKLGTIERAPWIVLSYLIASTIAAPVYGRLGDMFGRRHMMLAALAVFMAASVLCALSFTIEMLSLMRVLQGFGGGGLMTLSQALIGETVPPRERGRYQGYLAAVAVSSSTFGPFAGGYLNTWAGNRFFSSTFRSVSLPWCLCCVCNRVPGTAAAAHSMSLAFVCLPALLHLPCSRSSSCNAWIREPSPRQLRLPRQRPPRQSDCGGVSGGFHILCCRSRCWGIRRSGEATRLPPAMAPPWFHC
jgi:MFS family permease